MKTSMIAAIVSIFLQLSVFAQNQAFVRVESGQFYRGEVPYKFMGTNYWYGMYLGADTDFGDRERLKRELDQLQKLGVKNLRVLGSSEGSGAYQIAPALLDASGKYNKAVLEGLDFFLNELRKRDMTAVLIMNNFWMWSGGMPQYVSWVEGSEIPLPDIKGRGTWDPFINYSLQFYENEEAQKKYLKHLKKMLNRKNSFSGVKYKNDPTILSWQLANEPRGYNKQDAYRSWINSTAAYVKKKDKNHMISLGAEGNTSSDRAGIDLYLDNQYEAIDYATVHLWIQNWGWFKPGDNQTFEPALEKAALYLKSQIEKANELKKPIVLEEFGVSRDDGKYTLQSSTEYRDQFYQFIFENTYHSILEEGPIQGCNFWSWAGEGRTGNPGGFWMQGQDYTGDPPHDRQGWYSVFDEDKSTIEIIKAYAEKINQTEK